MPEIIKIQEKVERRTYLKGRLEGKFAGYLDIDKSDKERENFYDIELLSVKVMAEKSDFRNWQEGEFEDFAAVEKSPFELPVELPCEVNYEDGSAKHFLIELREPKLLNPRLINQIYEEEKIFTTLESAISGYLSHYEYIEREVIVEEKILEGENSSAKEESRRNDSTDIAGQRETANQPNNSQVQPTAEILNQSGSTTDIWGEKIDDDKKLVFETGFDTLKSKFQSIGQRAKSVYNFARHTDFHQFKKWTHWRNFSSALRFPSNNQDGCLTLLAFIFGVYLLLLILFYSIYIISSILLLTFTFLIDAWKTIFALIFIGVIFQMFFSLRFEESSVGKWFSRLFIIIFILLFLFLAKS